MTNLSGDDKEVAISNKESLLDIQANLAPH